jgi:hypothetical protein
MNKIRISTLALTLALSLVLISGLGLAQGPGPEAEVQEKITTPTISPPDTAVPDASGAPPESAPEPHELDPALADEIAGVERTAAMEPSAPDPAARALAVNALSTTGLLLVPDSTNDRVMALDPLTGNVIDANFIPSNSVVGTGVNAILSADARSILVSDQTGDVVHRFGLDGAYLGVFAPAGGVNTAILDNIRGISLDATGNLLVTVGAGANADAVAKFDASGNYLGNFVANGSGGLDSPFDVYRRAADWLVSATDSDAIHRYNLAGGYVVDFASVNTFPEQIAEAANGNVLVANFSPTDQEGVLEFTPAGAFVGRYDPVGLGGYRGVHELPNGNILTTTGAGVHEISRSGALVADKITGISGRYIEYVRIGPPPKACPAGSRAGELTTADSAFTRPFSSDGTCAPSVAGTVVYFDVFSYFLGGPTPHDLFASLVGGATFDSVLVFYQAPDGSQNPFDPTQPCLNLVAYNDDYPSVLQSQIDATGLRNGWVDVVVTTFSNGVTGTYILGASSQSCQPGETVTACNAGAIAVPATGTPAGPAAPYPSTIAVSGRPGFLTYVRVHLYGLDHTWPDDIDMLLVGPEGQNLILMSDTGGSTDLVNANLTFDDAADGPLPDAAQITSGTYQPTNYGTGDDFAAPAPAPSAATTLATFAGTGPNGTWSLYVVDDASGDVGNTHGGWCVELTFHKVRVFLPLVLRNAP